MILAQSLQFCGPQEGKVNVHHDCVRKRALSRSFDPFDRWIQAIQKITATGGSKLLTVGGRLAYADN
jgi:hypothetical protein